MANKRKLQTSEVEDVQSEEEQPQFQPDEHQPQLMADESTKLEEEQDDGQHDAENMDEDAKDEEFEEDNDGEGGDAEAILHEAAFTEQASAEANGSGEAEDEYVEEPLEKLVEPFGKEQLVLLVKEAVSKYPDLVESVQKLADADPGHRKIFVHGLGWDTTAETLRSVFGKYGEIEDCKAVVDKISGKSKGYAFILFKHRVGAKKALQQPQKKIGTRVTSCQLASAGPVPAPPPTAPPVSEYTQRKIFVTNVSVDVDPKKLVEFFSQFGEIEEGPLGIDKQTGKFKGFCLFVYKSLDSAKKALEEPHKPYEGTTLHCQKAVDGPKHSKPFQQQQHQHRPPNSFRKEKRPYPGVGNHGGGPGGHQMAPLDPSAGFNPAAVAPGLAPVLGQALTALLATQGAGLGINNVLGGQSGMNNPGYGQQGYGGGYGTQPGTQGGYPNPQIGAAARPPAGAPYMGPRPLG